MEFVERHERQRLRRHAKRGNINGMENFLDVFTALVRLLYVYAERGVVKRGKLIGWFCRFIELATMGNTIEDEPFDGYLSAVSANLDRGSLLRDRCEETNYLAIVHTALMISALRSHECGDRLAPGSYGETERFSLSVLVHGVRGLAVRSVWLRKAHDVLGYERPLPRAIVRERYAHDTGCVEDVGSLELCGRRQLLLTPIAECFRPAQRFGTTMRLVGEGPRLTCLASLERHHPTVEVILIQPSDEPFVPHCPDHTCDAVASDAVASDA